MTGQRATPRFSSTSSARQSTTAVLPSRLAVTAACEVAPPRAVSSPETRVIMAMSSGTVSGRSSTIGSPGFSVASLIDLAGAHRYPAGVSSAGHAHADGHGGPEAPRRGVEIRGVLGLLLHHGPLLQDVEVVGRHPTRR